MWGPARAAAVRTCTVERPAREVLGANLCNDLRELQLIQPSLDARNEVLIQLCDGNIGKVRGVNGSWEEGGGDSKTTKKPFFQPKNSTAGSASARTTTDLNQVVTNVGFRCRHESKQLIGQLVPQPAATRQRAVGSQGRGGEQAVDAGKPEIAATTTTITAACTLKTRDMAK
jgi:hypothetical protein